MLRVFSGNELFGLPMERRLEGDSGPKRWLKTRQAVQYFKSLLLCSKCGNMLQEPVCLGGCDHIFCRSCTSESLREGCSVCHTPTWQKDIQINRQLNGVVQLCNQLENLLMLGCDKEADPVMDENTPQSAVQPESREKPKKTVTIWYSPRTRKVRAKVEKAASKKNEVQQKEGQAAFSILQDTSVFEFPSSDSSTSQCAKVKKSAPRQKKKSLKKINKEWGFWQEGSNVKDSVNVESEVLEPPSKKMVSFSSWEPSVCDSVSAPDTKGGKKATVDISSAEAKETLTSISKKTSLKDFSNTSPRLERFIREIGLGNSDFCSPSVSHGAESVCPSDDTKPNEKSSSLLNCQVTKKPKKALPVSPAFSSRVTRRRSSSTEKDSTELNTGQLSPKVLSSPNKDLLITSPSSRGLHQDTGSLQRSPGNPGVFKRNHKGETPLHLAAIKGDALSAEQLLNNGADPNLKDHAGWTPLHEACHHGHFKVVELLLQKGALLNTPGYQNDSPLHDAVKNGHTTIVELLLLHGASQDVVNLFGLKPIQYAENEDLRNILQTAPKRLSCPKALTHSDKLTVDQQKNEKLILASSGLSKRQQSQLSKLTTLIKAGKAEQYNSCVTHIIIPDDHFPSAMTCMLGVLTGCWILKFQWVKASLETGKQAPEEMFEAADGPKRSRINRQQLLPGLFDGCYFYFLGPFKFPSKEDLIQLVKTGGGNILCRQPKPDSDVTQTINTVAYHALPDSDQSFCTQYILYDSSYKYKPKQVHLGKVWSAPVSWLLCCITSFQLLPVPELNS
ncbi:BRCA1-associated RING domain protein 1 isoform X1 [Polypterus senegalus]|uniref:BRCA1-associated RING domain protein 1 isoform X1 n=1 Tax=Polypterus senegalus TaxID=55291 RepID=UPI0019664419|nr:BRCA1-associated RING domain protein 1 isoform X1 [Polypterus senegalus]